MGLMRFRYPVDRISEPMLRQAYMSGYERVPWDAKLNVADGQLLVDRATADSGGLHLPWDVQGHGTLMVSTGTLQERSQPYELPLELARGKLAQLRNHTAEWLGQGAIGDSTARELTAEAIHCFGQAIGCRDDFQQSSRLADTSLRLALDACQELTAAYAERQLGPEGRDAKRLPGLLGVDLGRTLLDDATSGRVLEAFNAAILPISWNEVESTEGSFNWDIVDKQVEWCRTHKLRVCGGPLLNFAPRSFPDWLAIYEQDYPSFMSLASEFVRSVVDRYRGCVDLWVCAGRINTGQVLSLTDEQKVRATARIIQETHQLDPKTPIVASFDQPWGEYLTLQRDDYPPLHFADVLLRAELGLSGIMLEMNMAGMPHGSMPRDSVEMSRQLDYWGLLGMPLFLSVSVPGMGRPDPLAMRQATESTGQWTTERQAQWIAENVPLALAKPNVQGIFWNQLRDVEPHDFLHSGLFDLTRQPRPALSRFAEIKEAYL